MVYVRSLRGASRSGHVGLVPNSLACAASRRLPLSEAIRILGKPMLSLSLETGTEGLAAESSAPASDDRR